jgi:uncharacterized protein (TIGR02301 family)
MNALYFARVNGYLSYMRTTIGYAIAAAALLSIAMLSVPGNALAQSQGSTEQGDTGTGPQIKTLPPAYDAEMLRLAEILGALHYLRTLCETDEGPIWRRQMERLIEKEEPTAERRAQLVSRFNRGFRGFREVYRECTLAAAEAANRYRRQGIRLAAEIPDRYGN